MINEQYLYILKKDENIYLKIFNNNKYIYIRYILNDFYYSNEKGQIYPNEIVSLSFLLNEEIDWKNISLCYLSEKAFNKYWKDNFLYYRGKNKYPVYDLYFINEIHLIDFQKKLDFNYIQPFQPIKEEFKPIPTKENGHLYISL